MGDVSEHVRPQYELFARRWFARLVAVFLRSVRDPALAYDLATETLAAARLQWESAPVSDEAVGWLLWLGVGVLSAAVERGGVPATERRRGRQPTAKRLSASEQREITALAEAQIELPASAREPADALARTAPPRHVLQTLRLSGLVEAEPLSDRESSRDGG
jgi:predicted RNA polymerase sigma factor